MSTTILTLVVFGLGALTIIGLIILGLLQADRVSLLKTKIEDHVADLKSFRKLKEDLEADLRGQVERLNELVDAQARAMNSTITSYDEEVSDLRKQVAGAIEQAERKLETWKLQEEQTIREDALSRSRATMRGQATEHLAPYIQTSLSPKDFRFLGDPIDYIICAGSSAIRDGNANEIEKIVLLDIKTGKADLTKVQRRIRDAIIEGRVTFATYNTDKEEYREWQPEAHPPILSP